MRTITNINPDSKFHGANTGPTLFLLAPGGPHVNPMNLAIRECYLESQQSRNQHTPSPKLFLCWLLIRSFSFYSMKNYYCICRIMVFIWLDWNESGWPFAIMIIIKFLDTKDVLICYVWLVLWVSYSIELLLIEKIGLYPELIWGSIWLWMTIYSWLPS